MATRESKHLWSGQEGVTAIEFAFVAPVLMLFIMATVEYALVMYASSVIDGAISMSARAGKTGYIANNMTREDYILSILTTRISGLMDPNQVTLTSKNYSSFANINQPEPYTDSNSNNNYDISEPYSDINANGQWDPDMAAAGLGGPNDIVVYTASYPWPISTPIMQEFIGTNGVLTITASAVVKNEPYNVNAR